MKYLLETTTCSRLMVNDPKVEARLTSAQVNDDVFTCFIVKGEIRYGVERLPHRHQFKAFVVGNEAITCQ